MGSVSAYRTAELAELYDAVYGDEADVALWSSVAAASGGRSLLELGCGTGRVLIPLARSGYEVNGIDNSGSMLARCRSKLSAEEPSTRGRATLVEADMTSFRLNRRFDAVLCVFNTFHHIRTVDGQLACLQAARSHLEPGGMLVLDLFNPDPREGDEDVGSSESMRPLPAVDASVGSEFSDWTHGRAVRRVLTACEYDWSAQCNDCEMDYEVREPDGTTRRVRERFPLRLVHRFELEHLLARCGFRILEVYGDYRRSPFAPASLGMITLAIRES